MPIKFHCQFCGKLVSAPDSAGGKMGKCPYCHQTCYIASPRDQLEEVPMTPVDPEEEQRQKLLQQETLRLQQEILQDENTGENASGNAGQSGQVSQARTDLGQTIRGYLVHMARGELTVAETLAGTIGRHGQKAVDEIDRLSMEQILDPELAGVPPNIIAGFFRQLRKQIGA